MILQVIDKLPLFFLVNQLISELFFCIPDYADNSDLAEKLVKFLETNPDELNRKVNDLIFTAFKKTFPCKPENYLLK
ncbi:MAG TPA: hypothetical protein ENH82_16965 [bacterium]|nr:hypothetical protein [bacterium]